MLVVVLRYTEDPTRLGTYARSARRHSGQEAFLNLISLNALEQQPLQAPVVSVIAGNTL